MTGPRAYTLATVLEKLEMNRRTFFRLRAAGEIPCLLECKPRLGRLVRYRADLIDQWVDGRWNEDERKFFNRGRAALRAVGR